LGRPYALDLKCLLRTTELQLRGRLALPDELGYHCAIQTGLTTSSLFKFDGFRWPCLREKPRRYHGSLFRPQESVPHQGFCTAATVLPTIEGLFGIDYSASKNQIAFSPAVPAHWNEYTVSGIAIQAERLNVTYSRDSAAEAFELDLHAGPEIKCSGLDYESTNPTLLFNPFYQPGTHIESVMVNGESIPFETKLGSDTVQLLAELHLVPGISKVEVQTVRSLELIPPVWNSQVGDENRGLRILEFKNDGHIATITVEGRSGKTYPLSLRGANLIESVEGGMILTGEKVDFAQLAIEFPRVTESDFSVHTVTIRLN
jgi:hypothetical protein